MEKNWTAICEIRDPWLRMAIALLDMDTEEGKVVTSRLPMYFSDQPNDGPVPWSVLKQEVDHDALHMLVDVLLHHYIPMIHFRGEGVYPELPKTPDELKEFEEGDLCEYMGKQMLVVENGDQFVLAATDRIALDL